jgi:hypothetical protein
LKERNCGPDLEKKLQFGTKTARKLACNSQNTHPLVDDWLYCQSDSRKNPLAQFAARCTVVSLIVSEAQASPFGSMAALPRHQFDKTPTTRGLNDGGNAELFRVRFCLATAAFLGDRQ